MLAIAGAAIAAGVEGFSPSATRSFGVRTSPMKMAEAATEVDKMAALATAANEARGLAMDSIAAAHSGHMGLPLGCAEIGATLYGSQVSFRSHSP